MATNNPIDIGIRMADRTLAAFGIKPATEPQPLDMCQYCGFVYAAHGAITATCPDGLTSYASPKPAANYSPAMIAERAQLQRDIDNSERLLERFRTADEPAKRNEVARRLVTLSFAASLAVEFGCPDERIDVVLHQLNLFTQAFDALREVKGDIRLAEMEIDDAKRTLADAALWEQDGGAA